MTTAAATAAAVTRDRTCFRMGFPSEHRCTVGAGCRRIARLRTSRIYVEALRHLFASIANGLRLGALRTIAPMSRMVKPYPLSASRAYSTNRYRLSGDSSVPSSINGRYVLPLGIPTSLAPAAGAGAGGRGEFLGLVISR